MKKKNKKGLYILLGIVAVGVIIGIIVFNFSNRIVCKSSDGNITIFYNKNKLTSFNTTGSMSFDFDNQNSYVEKIGIKEYISKFKIWFEDNTDGSCKIKE